MSFEEKIKAIFEQLKEEWKGAPFGIPTMAIDRLQNKVLKAYAEEQAIERSLREGLAQTCTKLNFKIEYLEREITNIKEVDEARKQKLQEFLEWLKLNYGKFVSAEPIIRKLEKLTKE